jgi:glycine cleavage system pyridoxal-binding protein P
VHAAFCRLRLHPCGARCACVTHHTRALRASQVPDAAAVLKAGVAEGMNLRQVDAQHVGISMDETTTLADVDALLKVRLAARAACCASLRALAGGAPCSPSAHTTL